jgi:hypothetical protein
LSHAHKPFAGAARRIQRSLGKDPLHSHYAEPRLLGQIGGCHWRSSDEGAAEGRAGGDNIGVGWARPGESTSAPSEVIPASVLSPFSGGSQ